MVDRFASVGGFTRIPCSLSVALLVTEKFAAPALACQVFPSMLRDGPFKFTARYNVYTPVFIVSKKISLTEPPVLSEAVTFTCNAAASPLTGVPLNVLVVELNVNQDGSALPLDN